MKAQREHRVPLSARALEILATMKAMANGPDSFIFPGQRPGRPLSDMSLAMLMRRMGASAHTPHGFRSAFRDWAGEVSPYAREVAELALAHAVGDATERAYARGDALEKRRSMMADWAAYAAPEDPTDNIKPVLFGGR